MKEDRGSKFWMAVVLIFALIMFLYSDCDFWPAMESESGAQKLLLTR